MARISVDRAWGFMVGEENSPKLSLSNQAHMATLFEPLPSCTQEAWPPSEPALTGLAPGKRWSKVDTELAALAWARWPPMNMTICSSLPAAELPDSYTASTTLVAWPELILMTSLRSWATFVCFSRFWVRTYEPIVAGVARVCAGPLCEGNSNLMMPVIAAAATTTTPPRANHSRWSLLPPRRRPMVRLALSDLSLSSRSRNRPVYSMLLSSSSRQKSSKDSASSVCGAIGQEEVISGPSRPWPGRTLPRWGVSSSDASAGLAVLGFRARKSWTAVSASGACTGVPPGGVSSPTGADMKLSLGLVWAAFLRGWLGSACEPRVGCEP